MKTKIFMLLCICILFFTIMFTACNSNQNSSTTTPNTSNQVQNTPSKSYYKDGFEYELNDDNQSYSLSRVKEGTTSCVIPDTVNGLPVTGIKNVGHINSIQSITLPDSITNIGERAFYGCKYLTSINIPQGVISIGDYAFSSCASLTDITLGNNVESIGAGAFSGCVNLSNINLPDSITSIGDSAFSGCKSLKNITIPGKVTTIEKRLFENCVNLTSVTFNEGITSIDFNIFNGCTNLTNLSIPDSIEKFNLTIGTTHFNYLSFEASYLPAFEKLSYNQYDNAYYLGNGNNPYAVLVKSTSTDITSCDIHTNTRVIFHFAFNDNKIEEITVPASVKSINAGAFWNCKKLNSVELFCNNISSIEASTFYDCWSLKNITIPDSVTHIYETAFSGCNFENVEISDSVTHISGSAFTGISNFIVSDNNIAYTSIQGSLYSKDGKTLVCCSTNNNSHFKVPDGVTNLGEYAFSSCENITSIEIPESVINIGEWAFRYSYDYSCIIYYKGTQELWNSIEIHKETNMNSLTIYYYSETEPTTTGNFWHYVDGVPTAW